MLHLSPERLAALADSEPTMAESEHLAGCALCAQERIAYRSLLAHAVAERSRDALPLTRWDALARAVRAEGIFASARLSRRASPWWLQAAAAVVLVAGGVVAGRASVSVPDAPATAATVAAAGDTAEDAATFSSRSEALAAMARSESLYQQAAAFLVERDSAEREIDDSQVYRRRLAALDEVAATTEAALRDAPYDPVINRYYFTALGARQATLRQLRSALPDGEQLYRY